MKRLGFKKVSQKGSHIRFAHPDGRKTTIPDHGGKSVPHGLLIKMDKEIHKIVNELKSKIASKYKLKELKVFGSSARGDRRDDSDIDVYILIPEVNRKLEEELFDIAYDLELKYDCLIDLIVFDERTLNEKYGSTPFYQNVSTEGLNI